MFLAMANSGRCCVKKPVNALSLPGIDGKSNAVAGVLVTDNRPLSTLTSFVDDQLKKPSEFKMHDCPISVSNFAKTRRRAWTFVLAAFLATAQPLTAQTADTRPYDTQLFRLAEILGAIHYLRELCDADEGQQWRDQMRSLLSAEGATAVRRARLSRSFNNGYRSYARTYVNCTPSAKSVISKFLNEGVEISEALIKIQPQ